MSGRWRLRSGGLGRGTAIAGLGSRLCRGPVRIRLCMGVHMHTRKVAMRGVDIDIDIDTGLDIVPVGVCGWGLG